MLTYQISWRIKTLVRKLNLSNRAESLEEIDLLLPIMMSSSSGPSGFSNGNESDNRGMFIVSLLDDIDYIDIRNNGTRDTQKVSIVESHIIHENFLPFEIC